MLTFAPPAIFRGKASPRARRRLLSSSEKAARGAAVVGSTHSSPVSSDSEGTTADDGAAVVVATPTTDEGVERRRREQLLSCLSALESCRRWQLPAGDSSCNHHLLTYWDSSDREAMDGAANNSR